jgi:hypothetical protein
LVPKEVFLEALNIYSDSRVDIQDFFLASLSRISGATVITFDKSDSNLFSFGSNIFPPAPFRASRVKNLLPIPPHLIHPRTPPPPRPCPCLRWRGVSGFENPLTFIGIVVQFFNYEPDPAEWVDPETRKVISEVF